MNVCRNQGSWIFFCFYYSIRYYKFYFLFKKHIISWFLFYHMTFFVSFYLAGIVVLYHFLFSSFEHIYYVFKYGEEKMIQDNDSCHLYLYLFIGDTYLHIELWYFFLIVYDIMYRNFLLNKYIVCILQRILF